MAKTKNKKRSIKPKRPKKAVRRRGVKTAASSLPAETRTIRGFLQKRFGIICVALIALVGVLVYSNSFSGAFVFDDITNIVENPAIKSFGGLTGVTSFARIVGFLTFALNYKLGGLDVTGYHVFNLAVHLASALLVFWLVSLTLKTPFFEGSGLKGSRFAPLMIALFAGLLFVAHPVQTQAVTYIVQRFASLATLFYLLAIVMYVKWRLSEGGPAATSPFGYKITVGLGVKRAYFYVASLVALLLAMATKEIAFTLPLVIALWEFSFCNGGLKRRLLSLLPFALTLPVIPLALIGGEASLTTAPGGTGPPPAIDYFLTQSRVIVTYLRLLVFPVGQNLDYDYPVYQSFFNPNVLLSFVLLAMLASLGVFLWRIAAKRKEWTLLRLTAFGIFWFFITLAVESSFIAIPDVIYEHRLYLPSAGLIITSVTGIWVVAAALKKKVLWANKAAMAMLLFVVVALSVTAYARNSIWGDGISLWEDVASKSPAKARPHHNLGLVLMERGEIDRAQNEFDLALTSEPSYANAYKAHYSLGLYNQLHGQLDKAEAEFKRAIDLNPEFAPAYYNLGMTYVNQGRYTDAVQPFLITIELDPGNYEAYNNLGYIYALQNRFDEALAQYRTALSINPDYQKAKENIQLLENMRK